MHIETDLYPIHAQRLFDIQQRLQKPLPDVLATLIDLGQEQFIDPLADDAQPSALYAALEDIGFIGCLDADESLAADYKHRTYRWKNRHPFINLLALS